MAVNEPHMTKLCSELCAVLAGMLPKFEVPGVWVLLRALCLTSHMYVLARANNLQSAC